MTSLSRNVEKTSKTTRCMIKMFRGGGGEGVVDGVAVKDA